MRRNHTIIRVVAAALVAISTALGASLLLGVPSAGAATFLVNTCANSGTGSLPAAVASASPGDTITFDPSLSCPPSSPITLASTLEISQNLTITGPGPSAMAVSGGGSVGVFRFGFQATVTLSGLTIENGNAASGGGIANVGANVTVTDSTISGNSANLGGGIANDGTVTVTDSTISGNSASGAGGGIVNNIGGTVTVTDSTISGNSASGAGGGGIFTRAGGTVNVTGSTISGNTAASFGGGIANGATVNVGATIVAGNSGGVAPNCTGNAPTSLGYNLTNDAGTQCGFTQSTDVVNTDPLLGTLANNGGPTFTMLPASGSPAIGVIPPGTTLNSVPVCPRTDQRGVASAPGAKCTIGAVEVSPVFTITTTSLPAGKVGVPYSFQLQAVGGSPPYTWNKYRPVGGGVLVPRVMLSSSGLISGVPKRAGSFTFTVKCRDASHSHKTQVVATFTLVISP